MPTYDLVLHRRPHVGVKLVEHDAAPTVTSTATV